MDQYTFIVESVKEEFELTYPPWSNPQPSRVYIFFLINSGLMVYQDAPVDSTVLHKLIEKKIVKREKGDYFHQMQKCIRYRFVDYKYPSRYYRVVSKKLREIVFEKDNYRCVECGDYRNLNVDHIVPWSWGGYTEENNLQTLCFKCNMSKRCK